MMEVIGVAAGLLTLSTYVPQAYKTLKTKRTDDLSLATLVLLCGSALLRVISGILGNLRAVWATNAVVLILGLFILVTKATNARER